MVKILFFGFDSVQSVRLLKNLNDILHFRFVNCNLNHRIDLFQMEGILIQIEHSLCIILHCINGFKWQRLLATMLKLKKKREKTFGKLIIFLKAL